jgi:probable F420-dependent oxidoreductase
VGRPFRFGLIVETRQTTRSELIEQAKRAEDGGYDILLGTDHLGRLASLPLLQTAAEATGLRIGTLVLNNDNRHPVILAQELAAIDVVTDGRLEIGLGAGWDRPEYDAAAMPFDPPARRLARLKQTVAILKQALNEGRIEREAKDGFPAMRLEAMPRSVQRPHPPILIGGGGPRLLSYAAREADIVGLDPRAFPEGGHDPNDMSESAIDQKVAWMREAAGDRWTQLQLNVVVFGIGNEGMAGSPHYLSADQSQMTEQLLARRERWGINYLAFRTADVDAVAPVVARLAGS